MNEAHAVRRALPGLELTEAETGRLLDACEQIGCKIAGRREPDLADTHPAVIFDPALPCRRWTHEQSLADRTAGLGPTRGNAKGHRIGVGR
ncbi:MAG: hypothetical protein ACRYHQ_04305 [Janthinobacterium lividum]